MLYTKGDSLQCATTPQSCGIGEVDNALCGDDCEGDYTKKCCKISKKKEGASAVLIKSTSVPQMRMIPRVSAHPQMVLSRVSTQAVVKPSMFKRTRLHLRMLIFLV